MKFLVGSRPPWREFRVDPCGSCYVVSGGKPHPDPSRPMVWHEIVRPEGRNMRVVLRSQRPVSVLLGVLSPGERLYRAARKDRSARASTVRRRRVA